MLKRLMPKRITLLGVDISPTSIQILEASRSGSELCIEGYGSTSLPPQDFLDTNPEALISCIKILLSQINSSARIAALAVPDAAVISKTIQLVDNLNDFEMEELIFLEADNFFSSPVDKANLDFVVLGPSLNCSGMVDVLLAASKDNNLKRRIDILNNLGLEVKIVDIESYALATAVEQLIPNNNGCGRIAIIHISNESMSLFVWENGKRIYDEQKTRLEKDEVEIKKEFRAFFTTSRSELLDGIFLTGELSERRELAQKVQEETGIQTFIANPFKDRAISNNINLTELGKIAPVFAVAMGLILRLGNDY